MNDIRRFLSLRDSLIQERTKLETRLREINQALGESNFPATTDSSSASPVKGPGRRGGRRSSGISLREAVLQVTSKGPLSKEDILERVKGLGYRFSTNNPLNSLGVILYGKNPKFKNEGGRFSPTGTPVRVPSKAPHRRYLPANGASFLPKHAKRSQPHNALAGLKPKQTNNFRLKFKPGLIFRVLLK